MALIMQFDIFASGGLAITGSAGSALAGKTYVKSTNTVTSGGELTEHFKLVEMYPLGNVPNISLNPSGSATFNGDVTIGDLSSSSDERLKIGSGGSYLRFGTTGSGDND